MRKYHGFPAFKLLGILLVLCGLMLTGITAWAQSTTDGAIGGTVTDPQGAVVPSATVIIRNNGTNEEFKATTDSIGFFRQGGLKPNSYTVVVAASGFAAYKATNVVVTVGSLTTVSPKLKVGADESIDVSAEVPLINTVSADFAPTINETAIKNLPMNGGRWSSFSMLTPGVVSDANGFGLVSVRGISPLLNNVTVDGADNNQAYFSEERGRTRAGYSTPKIAVQEFQVNTSNYSVEYGRAAGAVINTVTKSGGNQIHGEAYWQDRSNEWGSTNPYTTRTDVVYGNGASSAPTGVNTYRYKPEDVRKMGGIALGGPLVKDKLFWFFAYDRFHRNFPGTAQPSSTSFFAMPDAALTTGVTCNGTGSAAPSTADANVCTLSKYMLQAGGTSSPSSTQITQNYAAAQALWVKYMFGNTGTNTLGLISDAGPTPRTGDQNIVLPKLDWIINSRNHLSLTANRMRWSSPAGIQTQATNNYGTNTFGNDFVSDTWGVAKLDTSITNNITNQLRFQFGRDFEWQTYQTPSAYDAALAGSSPYGLAPTVYIASSFYIGTTVYGNRIAYPDEYKTQIADTVAMQKGRHSLSFGLDWVHNSDTIKNLYQQYGYYSYSSVAGYFADLYHPSLKEYSSYYQGFQGSSSSTPVQSYQFATNDWGFFAQDNWRATRRLTVNLGLRLDTELLPSPYTSLANTITLGSSTINMGKLPGNPVSIGPRVGFAYDVFGDGKTVLRGGYGMYSGRIINSTIYSAMTATGNLSSAMSQPNYNIKYNSACAPSFPNVLATAPGCSASLTLNYMDPNFKLPQIHEVDLTLQRELGWKTVLSVSYLGSFGHHLQSFTDSNLATPATSYCAVKSTGLQTAASNCSGTSSTYVMLTPPSTINYTLSNQISGNNVSGLPLASGYAVTTPFYTSRLNNSYGGVIETVSSINSNYNALVVQLEKRMSNNVQFFANYTWSHALDNGVNGTTGAASYPAYVDPHNVHYAQYGNSNYNVPNRFAFYSVLTSPWRSNSWKRYLVEGWMASPMVQIQNGLGNSVTTASSYYPAQYVGTQEFQTPSSGMLGAGGAYMIPGTPRNGWQQPATYVVDLRLSKSVTLNERYKLEFTADGFNLLNHNNVTGVSTTAAYTGSITAPASGTASTVITSPTLVPYSSQVAGAAGAQYSLFNVPNSGNSNYVYSTRQFQLGARVQF